MCVCVLAFCLLPLPEQKPCTRSFFFFFSLSSLLSRDIRNLPSKEQVKVLSSFLVLHDSESGTPSTPPQELFLIWLLLFIGGLLEHLQDQFVGRFFLATMIPALFGQSDSNFCPSNCSSGSGGVSGGVYWTLSQYA